MNSLPDFPPDWGLEEQRAEARLRASKRRVDRWALRIELAIMGTFLIALAIGAPVFVKNVGLGLVLSAQGLVP